MAQVEIARFSDLYEAELARSFLGSHGVWSTVSDVHLSTVDPLMQRALGGVRLMGAMDEVVQARDLLDRARKGEFAQDPDEDPVAAGQGGRVLAAGMLAVFFLAGGYAAFALTAGRGPLKAVRVAGLILIALCVSPLLYLLYRGSF